MQVMDTAIPEVKLLKPRVFGDARGFFMESYNKRTLKAQLGLDLEFVQDNHSRSMQGVLRGLHYQIQQPQGKLVRVLSGKVFDVAVDLRQHAASFGQWVGEVLTAEGQEQLWIPPGFAHGFLVLSETADFIYKTTDYYAPEFERTVRWDDPQLAIDWPLTNAPQLSEKDRQGRLFADAEVYP
ncbi:dTDP-4-dehydrorhamnose 3,5-epimerase [Methylophaga frappieri]|uniref:dTDP-4-dehydrorhamnose 3,5-epimerase n=1 Tax=Methylophaga frappieri (strain ATCC BAA-2434 / DSM 25690 / JAM7) TaxID=754477 RepID=I1YG75_METFJ|nr:dTDP-4-dehydrorhamnose 3,5-epimerase [Methylophaga frappieri]AFJ01918.1 dTDP-4-dehydrorhamnose 3,5-epimerase [Methylophaga frappieri]